MTDQPEPIRKSQLPTTPPPEWEITTVGGKDSAVVRRRVTFGDWEPVFPNRWADEPAATVRDAARQTGQQPSPAALGITTEQALAGAHALGAVLSAAQPSGAQLTTAVPDPTTADDPTPLRWGLDDVFHNDDDTVTICLSGPDGEPYWLALEPERAAALRDDLAPPRDEQPAETQDTDEAEFTDASTAFMQIGQTPSLQGLRAELRIEGHPPLIGNYAGAGMRRLKKGVLAIEPMLLFAWAKTAAGAES